MAKKLTSKADLKSIQGELESLMKNDKNKGMLFLVDPEYALTKFGYEVDGDLKDDMLKKVNRKDPKHSLALKQIEAGQTSGWIKNITIKLNEKGGK